MIEIGQPKIEFHRQRLSALEAAGQPVWHREMRRHGFNDTRVAYARTCDGNRSAFADYERRVADIVALLGAEARRAVLDLGAGVGVFAVHAARYYGSIGAADVSRAMLRGMIVW